MPEIGMQYDKDDQFKARARLHQSRFRANRLKADWVGYGNRLAEADALAGKNFYAGYDGIFAAVQKRYRLAYTPLYYDMLRSQHVPWNLFIPLRFESDFALALLSTLFNITAKRIQCVSIEYVPPDPKEEFLNDNTSFDAYVEYVRTDSSIGAVGVEVKYTERGYSHGKTEKKRMSDFDSRYHVISKSSGLYKEERYELLQERKVKQFWRNQLLGESMLLHRKSSLKSFTSVVMYPAGNTYCSKACNAYLTCLKPEQSKGKFLPITFERFIEAGKGLASSNRIVEWLKYLEKRYIVVA